MDRPNHRAQEAPGARPSYRALKQRLGKARGAAARRLLGLGLARTGAIVLAAVAVALAFLAIRPGGWGPPVVAVGLLAVAAVTIVHQLLRPLLG
ncbi:MAG: hypothetical protein PVF43_13400, partial [Candidatus Eiseniibacteriota bacterium]